MIERLARRIGGFASSTAFRWANAAIERPKEVIPVPEPKKGLRLSRPSLPELGSRKGTLIVGAAAVGAVAVISSNARVRKEVGTRFRRLTTRVRSSSTFGNGAKNLTEKTKRELYRLAKTKNIPGRGTMSKKELERALSE
jgi:hypothetical protein